MHERVKLTDPCFVEEARLHRIAPVQYSFSGMVYGWGPVFDEAQQMRLVHQDQVCIVVEAPRA